MYLVDTNIFLEILLDQDRQERCKRFLQEELENLHLSDFSLHSIGVILLRRREGELLRRFLEDTLPNLALVGLPRERYGLVIDFAEQLNLDFDDCLPVCRGPNAKP